MPRVWSFPNLTVLVTGAARGIGWTIAERLARSGCAVIGADASFAAPRAHADAPRAGAVVPRHVDVRSESSVDALFDALDASAAALDALVHCAGIASFLPLLETSSRTWSDMLETNLTGAFLCTRAAAQRMQGRGGRIVHMGSVAGHRALPGNAAYAASKAGLWMLAQVLNEELAASGVQTTVLQLGAVDTDLWRRSELGRKAGELPPGALLEPGEVADAVLDVLARPLHLRIDEIRLLARGGIL